MTEDDKAEFVRRCEWMLRWHGRAIVEAQETQVVAVCVVNRLDIIQFKPHRLHSTQSVIRAQWRCEEGGISMLFTTVTSPARIALEWIRPDLVPAALRLLRQHMVLQEIADV